MSRRSDAPYRDQIEEEVRGLIYQGHDFSRTAKTPDPKSIDQPRRTPGGKRTQNGLLEQAALAARAGKRAPEAIAVYEKIHAGIWAFNGMFLLTDAWQELEPTRIIPSIVKLEVWKRDGGRCVLCGLADNLHCDHDLPYSKGGSSLTAKNIRLLCARHNLAKSDKIE